MATRKQPSKEVEQKPAKVDKKPQAKAATPAKKVNPPTKPTKLVKKQVFEGTVQKKAKLAKPTIQNSIIIGKMADSITNTFS